MPFFGNGRRIAMSIRPATKAAFLEPVADYLSALPTKDRVDAIAMVITILITRRFAGVAQMMLTRNGSRTDMANVPATILRLTAPLADYVSALPLAARVGVIAMIVKKLADHVQAIDAVSLGTTRDWKE